MGKKNVGGATQRAQSIQITLTILKNVDKSPLSWEYK